MMRNRDLVAVSVWTVLAVCAMFQFQLATTRFTEVVALVLGTLNVTFVLSVVWRRVAPWVWRFAGSTVVTLLVTLADHGAIRWPLDGQFLALVVMWGAWLAFLGVCLSLAWQVSDAAISWCETTWPIHPWALRLAEWGHRVEAKGKRLGEWMDRTGMTSIVFGVFMVAVSLLALGMNKDPSLPPLGVWGTRFIFMLNIGGFIAIVSTVVAPFRPWSRVVRTVPFALLGWSLARGTLPFLPQSRFLGTGLLWGALLVLGTHLVERATAHFFPTWRAKREKAHEAYLERLAEKVDMLTRK